MRPATCSSCGAPIIWAVSVKSGKPIPVDVAPVKEGGNVRLVENPGKHPTAVYLSPGEGTHVSHFATCPQAAQHRRK